MKCQASNAWVLPFTVSHLPGRPQSTDNATSRGAHACDAPDCTGCEIGSGVARGGQQVLGDSLPDVRWQVSGSQRGGHQMPGGRPAASCEWRAYRQKHRQGAGIHRGGHSFLTVPPQRNTARRSCHRISAPALACTQPNTMTEKGEKKSSGACAAGRVPMQSTAVEIDPRDAIHAALDRQASRALPPRALQVSLPPALLRGRITPIGDLEC